jgi:hypothetical protein
VLRFCSVLPGFSSGSVLPCLAASALQAAIALTDWLFRVDLLFNYRDNDPLFCQSPESSLLALIEAPASERDGVAQAIRVKAQLLAGLPSAAIGLDDPQLLEFKLSAMRARPRRCSDFL